MGRIRKHHLSDFHPSLSYSFAGTVKADLSAQYLVTFYSTAGTEEFE